MKAPKGSKMPRGDKTHILSYPCYDIQNKKNGALFSSLDCKIALNRAINRNLEALARQVYDYWFVQFEFSDTHGKPYKSSGGKMLYSEKHSDTHPELVYADECPELWQQHHELAKVKSLFYSLTNQAECKGTKYTVQIDLNSQRQIVIVLNL